MFGGGSNCGNTIRGDRDVGKHGAATFAKFSFEFQYFVGTPATDGYACAARNIPTRNARADARTSAGDKH